MPEQEALFAESRLARGRRLRREKWKRNGLLGLTSLTAFSLTVVFGALLTKPSQAYFTATVVNHNTAKATDEICGPGDDTHRNGDEHKEHPPGNGYGHCKPHQQGEEEAPPSDGEAPSDGETPSDGGTPSEEPPAVDPAPEAEVPPSDSSDGSDSVSDPLEQEAATQGGTL